MRSKFKWIFTLLVALTMQFSFAQKTVTGKVSDASGPLPGANIVVKGTKNATSTDFDGTYSIKAKEGDVLVFSFVGKDNKVATVGAGNVYNATLNAVEELTTVVVTGALGIKRTRNSVTSAQQTISSKELNQAAAPSVIQSLNGKVSGLQINTTNSGVKSSTRIVLRGLRTITGSSEALVVIDNAISTAALLGQLPPEVVESVTVIKGQQGAALYGEQGSNGVIIVTTKRGTKSDKAVISINSSIDFENVSFTPNRQTKYGQGWYSDNGWGTTAIPNNTPGAGYSTAVPFENGAWGPAFTDPRYAGTNQPTGLPQADGKFIIAPYTPNQDNIKSFFKTGILLQNGVSLNMGGDSGYAFISANRQTTDFIVNKDKLVRTSFLFKGGKKLGNFSLDGSANYIVESVSQTDAVLYTDLMGTATNVPTQLFTNPSNKTHWTPYNQSPYWTIENSRFDDAINTLNASLNLGYQFNKNISVNYNLNATFRNNISQYYNNGDLTDSTFDLTSVAGGNYFGATSLSYRTDFGIATINQIYNKSNISNRDLYGDLLINFDYKLTDKIGFKANLGNNFQDRRFEIETVGGVGFGKPGIYNIANILSPGSVDPIDTPVQFTDALNPTKLDNRKTQTRRYAFFANVDFAYSDYLFLNATARYEKSSVVKTSQFYPSVGVSFIPTLAFEGLKNNKVLNYAKLNASYVKTGNATGVNATETAGTPGVLGTGYPFGTSNSYLSPINQINPNIKPEFVTTKEFGFALGFFKDRFTFGASVYNSITDDLITRASTSSASGIATQKTNIGSIENNGYDIDFGIVPLKSNNFKWELKGNYSAFKTVVNSLSPGVDELVLNSVVGAGVFAIVGEEFPFIKTSGYTRDGNGSIIVGANGNPLINGTLVKAGKVNPDYIVGLTNSFEYKGLRLTAVVDFRKGGNIYSETKRELAFTGGLLDTAEIDRTAAYVVPNSVQIVGGVSVPNITRVNSATANLYAANGGYFFSNYRVIGENFLLDATAFKMREISLSYSLPEKMLQGVGISSFRFGVNARNLFVLLGDPFKGKSSYSNQGYTDPESNNTSNNNTRVNANATGISTQAQYPSTRTFGFSINATF